MSFILRQKPDSPACPPKRPTATDRATDSSAFGDKNDDDDRKGITALDPLGRLPACPPARLTAMARSVGSAKVAAVPAAALAGADHKKSLQGRAKG